MHHGLNILYDCNYCKLRPSNHPLLHVKAFGHGPLIRYVKLRVVRAPGMLGKFSPPPRVSDPVKHNGKCVTHVPWWMPWSLTRDFLFKSAARKTFPVYPAHVQLTNLRIRQDAHGVIVWNLISAMMYTICVQHILIEINCISDNRSSILCNLSHSTTTYTNFLNTPSIVSILKIV